MSDSESLERMTKSLIDLSQVVLSQKGSIRLLEAKVSSLEEQVAAIKVNLNLRS